MNDGVTAKQSQAAGKKWVALVRDMSGNDEITCSLVTAVVDEMRDFMRLDTYPSLEVWAVVEADWAKSEEAAAPEEELVADETCSKNRLYRSVKDLPRNILSGSWVKLEVVKPANYRPENKALAGLPPGIYRPISIFPPCLWRAGA